MASLTCPCGAKLVAPDQTPSIVCGRCARVIAVPQDEASATNLGLAQTMLQMPVPPPVIAPLPDALAAPAAPRPPKIWLGVGVVLAGAGLSAGLILWKLSGSHDEPTAPPPTKPALATPPVAKPPPVVTSPPATVAELLGREHEALASASIPGLTALLAPDAFGFAGDASEFALDGKTLAAAICHDLGPAPPGGVPVSETFSSVSQQDNNGAAAAWIVEELDIGGRHFAASQVAIRDAAGWRVVALHFASLLGNKRAYDLAKGHQLPDPAAIQTMSHGDGADAAAQAATAAFATRQDFIAAISDSEEAIDVGSAPGERVKGGPGFQKAFSGMRSELVRSGGMRTGASSGRYAWSAQNVDFSLTEKDGTKVTERFRVLAFLVKEATGWKIVLTQWSNGGPFP